MKQVLLFFFLLSTFFCSYGQITVTDVSFPEIGDTLKVSTAMNPDAADVGTPGEDKVWDFTSFEPTFSQELLVRNPMEGDAFAMFPDATHVVFGENGLESYYNVTENEYQRLGFKGPDPLNFGIETTPRFSPPLTERFAPITYGSTNTSHSDVLTALDWDELPAFITDSISFSPLPPPDSIGVEVSIDMESVVDAWGVLRIPGGTFPVLREKRTEYINSKVVAKLFILGWTDITGLIGEFLPAAGEILGIDTTYSYFFLNDESKEPIAFLQTDGEGALVAAEYKTIDIISRVASPSSSISRPNIYLSPNPLIKEAQFDIKNVKPGKYTIRVFNFLAVPVWEKQYLIRSSGFSAKESLDNLHMGHYFYCLIDEKGKILTTKRFIVIRP